MKVWSTARCRHTEHKQPSKERRQQAARCKCIQSKLLGLYLKHDDEEGGDGEHSPYLPSDLPEAAAPKQRTPLGLLAGRRHIVRVASEQEVERPDDGADDCD